MKHEQVVPDYWQMAKTSITFLALAGSGLILLRLIHAIFYLPEVMQRGQDLLNKRLTEFEQRQKKISEALGKTDENKPPSEVPETEEVPEPKKDQ